MQPQFCTIAVKFGVMTLQASETALTGCCFDAGSAPLTAPPSLLLAEAAQQLQEYFAGLRHEFTLPASPQGTPFQTAVWNLLRQIPWGETRTYGELAAVLGIPGGARAVGMACHANPIAVIIPCHRVVGSRRTLTGFAAGVEIKRELLMLEGALPPELFQTCRDRRR